MRTGLPRPGRSELLVAGAEFALDALADHVIDQAPRPDFLLAGGIRWTTKIVLFPVRFLFTAETGQEGTNHAAVTYYLGQRDAPAAALVSAALGWRTDPPEGDHALALLRAHLLLLYRHYLDDHIERLTVAGRPELAEAFRRWRAGLEDRAASARPREVLREDEHSSRNVWIRRAVKARGHFPNEAAALKCVYMAIMSLDPSTPSTSPSTDACPQAARRSTKTSYTNLFNPGVRSGLQP